MDQNYTLGRGKLYFSRFKVGTQVPEGLRYIGNTTTLALTIESENLDHFSSDEGIREKDDSVALEVTRTGSFTTDSIQPENIALFFFGQESTVVQIAAVSQQQTINDVIAGLAYRLGQSAANPAGYFGISKIGFNVAEASATLVAATGTLTVSAAGTDGDSVTIGGQTYVLRAVPSLPYDVDIGVDANGTAANLRAAINAGAGAGTVYGTGTLAHPDVVAAGAAASVTLTASVTGTAGNAIATTENGTSTSFGAATLTGGTGTSYIEGTDYSVDYDAGMITIISGGAITTGTDIKVLFGVAASSRARMLSGTQSVEGAMQYIANNPKGQNFHYYFPWVKITPNGDYELKGDEWQALPFNLEILKPVGVPAITMDGKPVYA